MKTQNVVDSFLNRFAQNSIAWFFCSSGFNSIRKALSNLIP